MTYTTEQIAQALNAAREGKGLSQRALAKLAGVPQSHISKIETGGVDLRLSSLVEIARALDLEVTLVPQKNLSAVQSLVRDSRVGKFIKERPSISRELRQLKITLSKLALKHPDLIEIAQVQRRVRELTHFSIPEAYADKLAEARRALRRYVRGGGENLPALKAALADIQDIRNALAHGANITPPTGRIKPVYSLEKDEHD